MKIFDWYNSLQPKKKLLTQILLFIFIFSLLTEIILAITLGYGTGGSGKFDGGLHIEGEIDYTTSNLVIHGREWEATFYNLSSVYVKFHDKNEELFEKTIFTSNLTFVSMYDQENTSSLELWDITEISKFGSATLEDFNTYIQLTSPTDNQLEGIMNITPDNDYLSFHNILIITDTETINASGSKWETFYLNGKTSDIRFEIQFYGNHSMYTGTELFYKPIDDTLRIKGEIWTHGFNGIIWSEGKLYFSGNPIFKTRDSGYLELKILQNPVSNPATHYRKSYDWELEMEGESMITNSIGIPFWVLGLTVSSLISLVIFFIKKRKEQKENQ